jgi:hypothetical protein
MFITLHCMNSKWIKDINIRPETLKLVQERACNTLEATGMGKDFFNRTPSSSATKRKGGQLGLHKMKSFCVRKEMVSKLKRPPGEWEKTFASYTLTKDLKPEYTGNLRN